jgi:hypothetical protein
MAKRLGVYLARLGKVHGPFTENEIENLISSGKMEQYTWIWDTKTSKWKALDPAPAPLLLSENTPLNEGSAPSTALSATDARTIRAICHDFQSLVSGSLTQITETGCELLSTDLCGSPQFTLQSRLILNLLNEKTGQAMNVKAKLLRVSRLKGAWSYQLRWDHCPALLESVA